MIKAYSYVRFSSAEQMRGDSLRRQTELSEKYAQEHGLAIDAEFHLQDLGLSAFDRSNIKKGALGCFLEEVKKGRITPGSFLLVESLDRLSRDQVMNALSIFMEILNHDITIVTLADNMVYNKQSMEVNQMTLLMSIMIMSRAHEESLTKSKRLKAAWASKIANAGDIKLTRRCPAWMKLSSDKKTFEFIPERVAIIKEIIHLSTIGTGQWVIARRLNERKEPNWSGRIDGWHLSYIAKILNSPALYGEFQPQMSVNGKLQPYGEPIANYFPALITKDQFLKLQAGRELRNFAKGKRGNDVPNLMTGLLKCGYCGGSMNLVGTKAKRRYGSDGSLLKHEKQKALVCDYGRRGIKCYAPRWEYKDFEKSFLMFCSGLQLAELLNGLDADNGQETLQDQLQITNAKIEENGRKLKNLLIAIENGDAPAALIARMTQVEDDARTLLHTKSELQNKINFLQTQAAVRDEELKTMQEILGRFETKEGDELYILRTAVAEHIRQFVKEIQIFPAGKLVDQNHLAMMREELSSAGFSAQRVNDYLESMRTAPARAGKSNRYASPRNSQRYFIIKTRNGGIRVVYPDFDDPTKILVDLPMANRKIDKLSLAA